ncbi:MAG: acetate kinase [Proteobacteria bacterium]|nr:MAG: acetate kinase [Pseudomonadota bacterium]
MRILVLNSGSSSIKAAVVETATGEASFEALAERLGEAAPSISWTHGATKGTEPLAPKADHDAAMTALLARLDAVGARDGVAGVGHRIVHGGEAFTTSVVIDAGVIAAVERVSHLAPLHNPPNLAGIRAAQAAFADLPHVAVFDTAFHQTMPPRAFHYGLPYALYEAHGVRRYGFHGTSHRYVAAEAVDRLDLDPAQAALITAHLGNGCSLAAVFGGNSRDTTMGLTPLEGVVMGTRSGDVDPGLHAFLADALGLDVHGVTRLLNKQSGLLGLSGVSNDMRTLLDASRDGNDRATLAIEVFCYRLARAVGALSVALPWLDALVFTGGIGEHAPAIRARVVAHLGILGFRLDRRANAEDLGRIDGPGGPAILVIPTNEALVIARDTAALVTGAAN